MPKFLEAKLKAQAAKQGFRGKRADKYVYGAMNNIGAMRGSQETAKGAEMQKKHDSEMSKFKGESHSYSFKRPKRKVLSRYAQREPSS